MADSFPFPIFSGLLTPEHKQKIGPALWEFLWCISKITKEIDEDGEKKGLVLGGKPIKYSEIAEDLGVSGSSVKRNMKRLEQYQYIEMKRAPYGEIIYVRNSKKFRKAKNDLSGQTKNGLSDRDRSKMTYPDRPKMDERQTENGLCNKDIKDINLTTTTEDDWLQDDRTPEQRAAINKVTGIWSSILKKPHVPNDDLALIDDLILEKKIPVDTIIEAMKQVYESFKKRYEDKPFKRITKFSYFLDRILELHHEKTNPSETQKTNNVRPFPKRPAEPARGNVIEKDIPDSVQLLKEMERQRKKELMEAT